MCLISGLVMGTRKRNQARFLSLRSLSFNEMEIILGQF